MRFYLVFLISLIFGCEENIQHKAKFDKTSYTLGYVSAKQLVQKRLKFDPDSVLAGMEDVLKGKPARVTEKEMEEITAKVNQALAEKAKKQAENNRQNALKFLAENGKRKGIIALKSGVQILVLRKADGPKPTVNDMVTVHYAGHLLSGVEFDSTYRRREAVKIGIKNTMRGLAEAFLHMPVGARYRVYIPPELGYGEKGTSNVPPNSLLIFDVEMLQIQTVKTN